MTDLLSPERVREMVEDIQGFAYQDRWAKTVLCLCRDYLTLWEKYDKLAEKYDVLALDVIELARVDGLNDLQNALKDEKSRD